MTPEKWLARVDAVSFRRRLLRWYDRHGRDFHWRRSSDLFAVWVSEVMLQQTTTTTVARRFPDFLKQFPTIESLAAASEEVVLRAWEGLGYYRRARNLHRAARIVLGEHGGAIPEIPEVLRTLPGLGRYSANAILSFGRNLPLPILEANTVRAWSRLCGVRGDATKQPNIGGLWHVAEALIPKRRARDFNLAMMDLGAVICTTRGPDCPKCPLRVDCLAFRSGRPEQFPLKPARASTVEERHAVVAIRCRGRVLVQKRGEVGRWAGMWEFPHAPLGEDVDGEAIARDLASRFARPVGRPVKLPRVRHGVMHYRIELECYLVQAAAPLPSPVGKSERRWATLLELSELPLSVAHRKIAAAVTAAPVGERRRAPRTT